MDGSAMSLLRRSQRLKGTREAILKLLAPSLGDCVVYGPDVRKETEFCVTYYWCEPAGLRSRLNVWIPNANNSWKIAMCCNVFLSLVILRPMNEELTTDAYFLLPIKCDKSLKGDFCQ